MYALNFVGGSKSQQLRVTFDGGAVTEISRVPKKRPRMSSPLPKSSWRGCSIP
jgi:hypothetical protein